MTKEGKSVLSRLLAIFSDNFGLSRIVSLVVVCFISLVTFLAIYWFIHSAPPRLLTITTGPAGSTFERNAERYRDILALNGVTLKILPSEGSLENLQRLENPASGVDIGFVQGGLTDATNTGNLVSLGNLFYEPLFVFYRGDTNISFISGLAGKRLAIGSAGSGTHSLAMTLLQTNGLANDGVTKLLNLDADDAQKSLLAGTIDAVFMMSDSASSQTLRTLLHAPGVRLLSFEQADAYTRRFNYLNKLRFPEGSIDFGKNLPSQDVWLIGPTVELVAHPKLNSAVSDLLLEAASEVNGKASMFQNKKEFPNPVEHEFTISAEAIRYYAKGKTFLYSERPFWLASLIHSFLVAFVPMMVVLIPGLRLIPAAYKWRFRLRFYRWYRTLLVLERDLIGEMTVEKWDEMHRRLDEIEKVVKRMKVPASFADQFYGLRGHIDYVREKLANLAPAGKK
jgi:TRAP-type uncharacterized transport system substrate-binding protein